MSAMTEPHRALVARLSSDFTAISQYMARVSTDLTALDRLLSEQPPVAPPVPQPYPVPYWPQYQPQYAPPPQQAAPQQAVPPVQPVVPKAPRDEGWIGKLLAVAGVAVTLVGVVLLLVLAAQAGLLRPEFRVAAGGVLAVATGGSGRMAVPAARWTGRCHRPGRYGRRRGLHGRHRRHDHLRLGVRAGRPGRRRDHRRWRPDPGPRWDSQHLGVLVLVPLIVLAPVVAGGITLLLVSFMLALAAASLPVQLGKDWIWLHCARIAASTFPLIIALLAVYFDDRRDLWLVGACGIAAVLAVAAALILLPRTANRVLMALLTAAGVLPVLCVALVADRVVAALMAAALAAALLAIVLLGGRLTGVDGVVRQIWAALSAISATIAVLVAFDGHVAGPVLLAMAVVVAVAGRREAIAQMGRRSASPPSEPPST